MIVDTEHTITLDGEDVDVIIRSSCNRDQEIEIDEIVRVDSGDVLILSNEDETAIIQWLYDNMDGSDYEPPYMEWDQ